MIKKIGLSILLNKTDKIMIFFTFYQEYLQKSLSSAKIQTLKIFVWLLQVHINKLSCYQKGLQAMSLIQVVS